MFTASVTVPAGRPFCRHALPAHLAGCGPKSGVDRPRYCMPAAARGTRFRSEPDDLDGAPGIGDGAEPVTMTIGSGAPQIGATIAAISSALF